MTRDADVAAQLLAELVAFKTQQAGADGIAGDERPICEHLAPLLRARGADEVAIGSGTCTDGRTGAYVLARWGTPRRIINAHIDTVPANAGWSRDPWQPHIADGRLYGLGASDTKGAIAATLVALDTAKPRDFGVLFSGDEEAGSGVMQAFLASPHAAPIREVIVCEPTARAAGIAHRGVLAQHATSLGPGGHSSKADHLPKPIAKLARLAAVLDDAALRRLHEGPAGMTGTCLNLAGLTGGVAFNVIPARGQLEWSLRPYPGFDRASWDREVAELARAIDPQITLETTLDHEPFACDALAELARPFAKRVGALDFWTEAALWAAAGKDAIVIGPGDIAQAHAADEFVELADLAWAIELFRAVIETQR
ncbi:MAG: M20/M25/M40 family metallo-hydrolase [Deltaproteobacteria bacterium]|nr:M20/M25/M40 family metallo-hydrolase [Deltaproteobacteria bacterium]MDQ3299078.1 M20/M25/M40 family metallo-hydrolase [Myxococcota bacterium]